MKAPQWRTLAWPTVVVLLFTACTQVPTSDENFGDRIRALVFDSKADEAYLARPDGSDRRVVAPIRTDGPWRASPDGSRLAHWRSRGIWVGEVPDLELKRIVSRHDLEGLSPGHVVWTHDGTGLYFTTRRGLGGPDQPQGDIFQSKIWQVNNDGSNLRVIKSWTMLDLVSLAAVAPNGLVYWFRNSGHGDVRFHLSTLDPDTGEVRRLMDEDVGFGAHDYQLSPDFSRLYYSQQTISGDGPIVQRDLIDGGSRRLGKREAFDLVLSPREDALFFARFWPRGPGPTIFRVSLPDGTTERFFDDAPNWPRPVSVSPDGRHVWVERDWDQESKELPDSHYVLDVVTGDLAGRFPFTSALLAWIVLP